MARLLFGSAYTEPSALEDGGRLGERGLGCREPARWEGVAVASGDRDCYADPTGDIHTVDDAGFESAGGTEASGDVDQVCLDLTGAWPRVEVRTVAAPAEVDGWAATPWDGSVVDLRLRTGAGDHLVRTRVSSHGASMMNRLPDGGWHSCFSNEAPVVEGRTLAVTLQGECLPDQGVVDGATTSWQFEVGPKRRRLAGADRFATAALAARTWTPSARTVFLATGRDFPDALAAAPAAATDGAPVALVERDRVPAATAELLRDLRPERVVLIGGTVAIAPSVADAVAELTGRAPERLAGGDRYGTAVEVAQATYDAGVDTVLVATGTGFADALAGGAVAAAHGWPLLLTPPGGLPTAVRDELGRLDPRRIVVLGGETAVPASLMDALGPHADRVDRVAGGDRYATAAEIADRLGPFPPDEAVVATGRNFADALAAAAAAGGRGAPVLLTDGTSASLPTLRMAPLLSPPVITFMGGTAAVSTEVEDAFTGR